MLGLQADSIKLMAKTNEHIIFVRFIVVSLGKHSYLWCLMEHYARYGSRDVGGLYGFDDA